MASSSSSVILVAGELAPLLPAIRRAVAGSLRVEEEVTVALTRSRAYALVAVLRSAGAPPVSIAAIDAFIGGGGGGGEGGDRATALVVSHADPRVDVVAVAQRVVAGLVARYDGAGGAGGALLAATTSVDALFCGPAAAAARRSARILAAPTATAAAAAAEQLSKYRTLDQRTASAAAAAPATSATTATPATVIEDEFSGTIRPVTADRPFTRRVTARHEAVDMEQLMAFVFPPRQLHPRSSGRLILFALHGPLTPDGALAGGRAGSRPLTLREMDVMIRAIEREDVLAAYTGGSVLCDTAGVAVEVHAESRGLPQLSYAQVEAMFIDLPRDASGRCSFHDIQDRVLAARAQNLADAKRMYTAVTAADRDPAVQRTRLRPALPLAGRGSVATRLAASALAGAMVATPAPTTVGPGTASAPLGTTSTMRSAGAPAGPALAATMINLSTTGVLSRRVTSSGGTPARAATAAGGRHHALPGSDVTASYRPAKVADRDAFHATERSMHRGSCQVLGVDDLHHPDTAARIVSSLRMAREDFAHRAPSASATMRATLSRPAFDLMTPLHLHPARGSGVPSARAAPPPAHM